MTPADEATFIMAELGRLELQALGRVKHGDVSEAIGRAG
jgi:hypothetical protein